MKIAFKNFGCRANSQDTDSLHFEAIEKGYVVVPDLSQADVYIINSCTVTHQADRDARRELHRFKRQNPNAFVVVMGCYAQVAKDELLKLNDVDLILGTGEKNRVFDFLKTEKTNRDQVKEPNGFLVHSFRGSRNHRAPIKIQDGCNFKCSFCIIPKARGRSRSLPTETILNQIETAYSMGFHEVVLTGIHLAHFGWDRDTNLIELLREIFKAKTGPRIRLSTLDPFEIPDELIDLSLSEERFCPHFHIALQSGSDEILSKMRRLYKAHEFFLVVNKIMKRNPDTFIGVDVIVGFPGEETTHFDETLALLERSPWSKLHVFPYSERERTEAIQISPKVPNQETTRRKNILLSLSDEKYRSFLTNQIGKTKKVIIEKHKRDQVLIGHTENYLPVKLRSPSSRPGNMTLCRLTEVNGLFANAVECPSISA